MQLVLLFCHSVLFLHKMAVKTDSSYFKLLIFIGWNFCFIPHSIQSMVSRYIYKTPYVTNLHALFYDYKTVHLLVLKTDIYHVNKQSFSVLCLYKPISFSFSCQFNAVLIADVIPCFRNWSHIWDAKTDYVQTAVIYWLKKQNGDLCWQGVPKVHYAAQ
jgi:hypothetical protein